MSDEVPDRDALVRSTIITMFFMIIFLVIGIAFWFWSLPENIDTSLVGTLNNFNPFIATIIEILLMFGVFVFLTVTVVNLRLGLTKIRAGWVEIVLLLIVMTAVAWLMFGMEVGLASLVTFLGFIVYLYLLQE